MFYEEMSDDLLVCMYRERNQFAIDLLFERYKKYIYGFINDLLKKETLYLNYDELYQDSIIVFMNCIENYDCECGWFYTFVKKAIERKVIDKIRKTKRYYKIVSLDKVMYDNGNESCVDYVSEQEVKDTYLYDELVQKLDDKSKLVIDLKLEGYTYHEISNMIGIGKQSVFRRINKIRNILKDIIEKID